MLVHITQSAQQFMVFVASKQVHFSSSSIGIAYQPDTSHATTMLHILGYLHLTEHAGVVLQQ